MKLNLNYQPQLFQRITAVDKLTFTKHLAVMLKSGISISETLTTLRDQTKSLKLKKIISGVYDSVENGQQLSNSLEKYPEVFNPIYVKLIRIGEESGTLEENLEYLAEKLSKDYALQKKLQGILVYPMVVVFTALAITIAISYFVLPKLTELFLSLDIQLPLSTKILIASSNIIRRYNILLLIGAVLIYSLFKLIVRSRVVKPHWHKFILSFPISGRFLLNVQFASLFRNLGIMLRSGLSITSALQVSYNTSDNVVIQKYVDGLQNAILQGRSLTSELNTGQYKLLPAMAIKIVGVGEKSGNLDDMLIYLGDFFEQEVDTMAKNLPTILEPTLLVLIGLLVAFIAMSIITPIYQLTGSIQK